jgi:hypothetical protein
MSVECFFARQPGAGACDGQLIRAHLVPRQLLKREGHAGLVDDPRTWVPCCGGPTGIGGHHGQLDYSRKLRIPPYRLPAEFVALMTDIGLGWWISKHYAYEPRS